MHCYYSFSGVSFHLTFHGWLTFRNFWQQKIQTLTHGVRTWLRCAFQRLQNRSSTKGDLALVNAEDLSHFQELAEKIKQLPEILGWNSEATCRLVGCLNACGLVKMTPTNHHASGKTWTQMHGMFRLQALAITRHGFFSDSSLTWRPCFFWFQAGNCYFQWWLQGGPLFINWSYNYPL